MAAGPTPPLVFAHRGSSEALPEHTLAAYLRALAEGADGLECDVRLTRDGHLVCVHDGRLDRTSNGSGWVSARTLAELDALDFGSWHRPVGAAAVALGDGLPGDAAAPGDGPTGDAIGDGAPTGPAPLDPDRTRVLTLDRLLTAVRDCGRPVRLLIETKHPSRYGPEVERRLIALLREHGLADPEPGDAVSVTVMSFSALALRRVRRLAPRLPTAYLMEFLPPGVGGGRLPFGARVAGPGIALVRSRPHLVPALRAAGQQVYVWTVNEPADLALLLRQGVDGIITDRPGFVLEQLGR